MYFKSKDQLRIDILSKYLDGQLITDDACTILEVSERHFRRLVKRFREFGIDSIRHGGLGRVPPNRTLLAIETKIISLFRNKYYGFNLRHFYEKLTIELNDVPSYSTVRRILKEAKVYLPRPRKQKRQRGLRSRYRKEGIMVQIDGSHHKWFNREFSCLTAAIDDATGKILSAKFSPSETTFDAMDVISDIIDKKGLFQMLYSDKAGIYSSKKREGYSQLELSLKRIGITSITANSPQAKGRIERLFKTLQDRLVNELRLRNIQTLSEANDFLPGFIEYFNSKFSYQAADIVPAYKEVPKNMKVEECLYLSYERVVQNGLYFSFKSKKYVLPNTYNFPTKGKIVEVRVFSSGLKKFYFNGREIPVEEFSEYKQVS